MAAGTKYNITPEFKPEEIYRVETGVRKSGPWKLDTTNLTPGSILPVFTPVEANFKTRVITVVRNVIAYAAATSADTTLKIAKGSLAYKGMFLGDGKKGGEVTAIDTTNANYDEVTFAAAFGSDVAKGDVLFEATTVGGTKKKNTANFVMYDAKKVETDGPVLCTLLMQAYEVKESKLQLPIHKLDKVELTSRFQFE